MLIISGHLTVDPSRRDEYVTVLADLVRRSRQAPGCLDAAITADPVDPARVNNLERWASWDELTAWRAVCDAPDPGIDVHDARVSMWDATGERDPFTPEA